jgi:hypothetical protein
MSDLKMGDDILRDLKHKRKYQDEQSCKNQRAFDQARHYTKPESGEYFVMRHEQIVCRTHNEEKANEEAKKEDSWLHIESDQTKIAYLESELHELKMYIQKRKIEEKKKENEEQRAKEGKEKERQIESYIFENTPTKYWKNAKIALWLCHLLDVSVRSQNGIMLDNYVLQYIPDLATLFSFTGTDIEKIPLVKVESIPFILNQITKLKRRYIIEKLEGANERLEKLEEKARQTELLPEVLDEKSAISEQSEHLSEDQG